MTGPDASGCPVAPTLGRPVAYSEILRDPGPPRPFRVPGRSVPADASVTRQTKETL